MRVARVGGTVNAPRVALRTAPVHTGSLGSYLGRRTTLELVVLDVFVVLAGLLALTPGLSDPGSLRVPLLVVLSPGLLLVARSAVVAAGVPSWRTAASLDPAAVPEAHPRLDEARRLAQAGLVLLAASVAAAVVLAVVVVVAATSAPLL
jgi:hypothetical protein